MGVAMKRFPVPAWKQRVARVTKRTVEGRQQPSGSSWSFSSDYDSYYAPFFRWKKPVLEKKPTHPTPMVTDAFPSEVERFSQLPIQDQLPVLSYGPMLNPRFDASNELGYGGATGGQQEHQEWESRTVQWSKPEDPTTMQTSEKATFRGDGFPLCPHALPTPPIVEDENFEEFGVLPKKARSVKFEKEEEDDQLLSEKVRLLVPFGTKTPSNVLCVVFD